MRLQLERVRTRGRAEVPVEIGAVRELEDVDLSALDQPRDSTPPKVQRLRERHHSLARCLADGMSDTEAALSVGYHPSRVSILKGDPTFSALVDMYRAQKDEIYRDFHAVMGAVGTEALQVIADRLEEQEATFTNRELLSIAEFSADRTGYGPASKTEHTHTVNFGARLEAARQRNLVKEPE